MLHIVQERFICSERLRSDQQRIRNATQPGIFQRAVLVALNDVSGHAMTVLAQFAADTQGIAFVLAEIDQQTICAGTNRNRVGFLKGL